MTLLRRLGAWLLRSSYLLGADLMWHLVALACSAAVMFWLEGLVGAIRQEHENGMSKTRLALLTGISWRQIGRIVGRESWPYVA